ncbi:MAG: hypothetical protein HN566_12640 [Polaribacter sp.]|nr:hypothetical protein [Polaribacter sp.]
MIRFFVIALLTISPGCLHPPVETPVFNTKCIDGRSDHISILLIDDQVAFDIASQTGIGKGFIELVAGQWPAKVTLNLHLKGLEGLNISTDSKHVELDELTAIKHETQTACYYEVELPNALLIGTQNINVQWIDFYR